MNDFIICNGKNDPEKSGMWPYAVILRRSTLVRDARDNETVTEDFVYRTATYEGNGMWIIRHDGTRASRLLPSMKDENPWIADPDTIGYELVMESGEGTYNYASCTEIFAYSSFPEPPEGTDVQFVE